MRIDQLDERFNDPSLPMEQRKVLLFRWWLSRDLPYPYRNFEDQLVSAAEGNFDEEDEAVENNEFIEEGNSDEDGNRAA